jgi:hypothetical protein
MKITLAKSLVEKNRLVKKISKIKEDIRLYNVRLVGSEQEVDVNAKWEELLKLVDLLINLKFKIMACNMHCDDALNGIQKDIFRLSELKSLVSFIKGLNTQHGISDGGYLMSRGEPKEYIAIFRKSDVDEKVEELEKEINDIQESINQYNYETKLTFDFKGLI